MEEKKKSRKGLLILIVIILFGMWLFSDDEDVDEVVQNSGDGTYTLMMYMCGSDLESDAGYASDDIEEMLDSQLADEVNLLVYTGGASSWYDHGISGSTNQIYKVEGKNLVLVKDNIGKKYMSSAETLAEYLRFAKENYPADKYGLILWDHGGGAVSGFGYDENNPDEDDSLTLDELKSALDSFGTKLDFIGFDACLMANVETAYAVKNNANYFIASEETEPGTGWDYKKILNKLSSNSSQTGSDLAPTIVDTFVASNNGFFGADATLSCVDLSKMDNVYSKLVVFMKDIESTLNSNNFAKVSKAISDTKAYADGEIDTIDLVNFSENINVSSSNALSDAIKDAVIYNKTTDYVENSNGLSIYIPNTDLSHYQDMIRVYGNIGITDEYISALTQYANIAAGGRNNYYYVNNHKYENEFAEDYEEYSWYDEDIASEYEDYYYDMRHDVGELEVIDKGEYFALHLTDEEWENIVSVESVLWYDDGEGYLDLGVDSYFEMDEDDDLVVSSDGTWIAINGQNVMYEVVESTENYEKGKVSALLNDEEVNLIIYYDKDHPDGEVVGAEPVGCYGNTTMYGRGYIEIKPGDKIDFIIDYYDYDGNYDDSYLCGDTLTVGSDGLKVSYEYVGDGECLIYYMLTDIYGNVYYTEPVIMY